TPAIRPLAMRSHTLARPIKAPPAKAGRGVKFSIVMVFRQLFDPQSSTYTYRPADAASREALLIDPVFEQARRDVALVEELGLKLSWTLETHVHADHVTGAWLLKQRLGSRIALSRASGAHGADRYLEPGEEIRFGGRCLEARPTPGHTSGCMSYVLDDRSMAFSGDALLIRGCGRTDFQEGDPCTLFRSVREQIFSLPERCLIYPGHDYRGLTVTSVGEEKLYNPRLGESIGEQDFVGYMKHIGLTPLGRLLNDAERLSKEKPVVTVCRYGARSAQATVLLGTAGFGKVANLSGGMLRWRAQRFTVEGGSD